jgi:arabinogalactan oligomer / maltooligosaccharide transport system substrate-binding protein
MNRKFALGSLVLAASMILSACGGATPTAAPKAEAPAAATQAPAATEAPAPTEAPKAEVKEVTFWHAYGTGSAEETAMTKLVAQAGKDLPNIKINVLQIPFNDIFNKYRTDVAAGSGPDMFIAPNDSLGDDARAGLIADITDLVKGKLDGNVQTAIDGMTLDGKIYGVPESLKAVAMFYNKDMVKDVPKTTDDLLKAIEGGAPIAISFGCYHHYGFFGAFGGQVFDKDWKVVADQGGVVEAMDFLNKAYQVAKKNGWPKNDGDAASPFKEGKIAATFNGNWALGDYKKALGDKLGVAPIPAGPKGPATPMLGVDGFYINPNSTNKEAAIELALYLTNKASQSTMMNDAGHVPTRSDVEVTDPVVKGFVDAFAAGVTVRPQVPQLGNYWSNFCGTDEVFEKGVAPADWVKTATANANKPK